MSKLAALLLDMDGTSVDSEHWWMDSEVALARRYGFEFDRAKGIDFVGTSLISTATWFKDWMGVDVPAEELENQLLQHVVEAVKTEPLTFRPGFFECLEAFAAEGVPVGLVTSSHRDMVQALESRLPAGTFAVTVAGNEVSAHKPDPEPYLKAARLLGVDVRDCVAVEDSPSGLKSALASGACVVGIECMNPIIDDPRIVRMDSLAQLTPRVARELLAAH